MDYPPFVSPTGVVLQLREGDWMECRGFHLAAGLIRYYCNSVTNHGQPIHFDEESGQWVVLEARFPRMQVNTLHDEMELAMTGNFDFYLCRQGAIDQDDYEDAAKTLGDKLQKDKPYYNIWAVAKFWWLFHKLHRARKKFHRMVARIASRSTNGDPRKQQANLRDLYEQLKQVKALELSLQRFYYCTGIWLEIFKLAKYDAFEVNYCTPKEAEIFSRNECNYICGVVGGAPSHKLWSEIIVHWWPKGKEEPIK